MDKMVYLAMSGAKQNMLALNARANNLANVSTTGFKADLAQARAMPVFGEEFPSRVYAMTERPGTDFSGGTLIQTGRDLDIAPEGRSWFAVQGFDGGEAYTRSGDLHIDAAGQLLTGKGLPVIGEGGPIVLPPFDKIDIGFDGTITVIPEGAQGAQQVVIDRIKLVSPEDEDILKGPDGLVRTPDGAVLPADINARVASGFLESSNVNAVHELTEMISISRQFELQIKLMNNADQLSESAARVLQLS